MRGISRTLVRYTATRIFLPTKNIKQYVLTFINKWYLDNLLKKVKWDLLIPTYIST